MLLIEAFATVGEFAGGRLGAPPWRDLQRPIGIGERLARRADAFVNFTPSHDDVALIAFTSGTTGKPKATLHFHRDVLTICQTVTDSVLRLEPTDIVAGAAPLGFTYGLGSLLLLPVWPAPRRGCWSAAPPTFRRVACGGRRSLR